MPIHGPGVYAGISKRELDELRSELKSDIQAVGNVVATKGQLETLATYVIDNVSTTKHIDRLESKMDAQFERLFTELAEIKAKLP